MHSRLAQVLAARAKNFQTRGLALERVDQVGAMGIARGFAGDEQDSRIGDWGLGIGDWQSHSKR
ncbi:MAG TPA: hypothetical protein VKJ47_01005 [Candidatus Binatia bacterium]|nr:hypothetical protein [Candidatus Binatia bacterium]